MKFDVIIGNPPYNKGLLKSNFFYADELLNKAANIRIDAAFAVWCYELLNDNAISLLLYPERWMQLKSWENYRKWILNSGLKKVITPSKTFGKNVETTGAIHIQQRNYTGVIEIINEKRGAYNYNGEANILPYAFGQLGYEIHKKMMQYKHKLNFSMTDNKSENIQISSAYGLGGLLNSPTTTFKDINIKFRNSLIGVVMDNHTAKNKRFILCDDKMHKERLKKWIYSQIFNFEFMQINADFNHSQGKIGILPDVVKNMNGEYSDEKAVEELKLSNEEFEHIIKVFNE